MRKRLLGLLALVAVIVALLPLGAVADSSDNPNHPDYWEALYPDAVACYKYDPPEKQNAHGSLTDGGKSVTLNEFQQAWPGDRWEVLIVNGGAEDVGHGKGNEVYELPEAGKAYFPPLNNGGEQPNVSHWIVCKGEAPTTPPVSSLTAEASCGEVTVTSVNHSGLLVVVDFGYGEATRDGTAFGAPPDLIIAEGPRAGQPFGLFYESPNGMLFAVANGATESRTLEIPEDEGGGEVVVTYRIKAGPEQLNHTIDFTIPVVTDCFNKVIPAIPTTTDATCNMDGTIVVPDDTANLDYELVEGGVEVTLVGEDVEFGALPDGYELSEDEQSAFFAITAPEATNDCFAIEVGQSCGVVTGKVTANNTEFAAFISGVEGSEAPVLNDHPWASLNAFGVDTPEDEVLSHQFPEDYNGGSVTVTLFAHGPEQDVYAVDGRSPYSETLTIVTDCEPPASTSTTMPTTTTTAPSTTTTVEETTTSSVAESTTTTAAPTTPTTEGTLPFTGIEDFYLPTAIALVAAGGLLLALSRRPEEDVA